jgi:hypothetical protein
MKAITPVYIVMLVALCSSYTLAQSFDIANIPEQLKSNSDAVIRVDETVFTIENQSNGKQEKYWAVTILNERGEEMHNRFVAYYDKLSKIKKIEGRIYDAQGKLMKTLRASEISDIGVSAFGNDVGDARVKVAEFGKKAYAYPYTVEFRYVSESSNMMFYAVWSPYQMERTSIEKTSFTVLAPENFPFRRKEISIGKAIETNCPSNQKCYKWTLENLPAYENEPNQPEEIHPCVMTAPTAFEVQGYQGTINEWADIGKFYYALNRERDLLPEAIKAKAKDLVKEDTDLKLKVKKLYEYLQSNTRYMSIQLGLGGWQTIPATEVAAKGYGDCKALSNYMKALLNAAGIPAYQALVAAGPDAIIAYPDFPCMRFNHVITCVPLLNDTLWLECTSQTNSMGYQGSFTGNRKALVIKPEGGQLVNTTIYHPSDNKQLRKATIRVQEDGSAEANVTTVYTGIQQESRHALMTELNSENQKKWLLDHIRISSFDLNGFSFSERKSLVPAVTEELKLTVKKMASQSGTRVFIVPNLMTGFMEVPLTDSERKADLYLDPDRYDFQDTDTLIYKLPATLVLEHLPAPVKISSKFGDYSKETLVKDGQLMHYRSVTVRSGTYPKADFKEWADFIKKVIKSDKEAVVFISKT